MQKQRSAIDEIEEYDWSLPDLELPSSFHKEDLKHAGTKKSDHNAAAADAVRCALNESSSVPEPKPIVR